jgi:hypothetical protein
MGLPFPGAPTAFDVLLSEGRLRAGLHFFPKPLTHLPDCTIWDAVLRVKQERHLTKGMLALSTSPRKGSLILVMLSVAFVCRAQAPQSAAPAHDPDELVRKVVYNELHAPDSGEFHAWKQKQVKPSRTTTKQYVETPDGLLGRLLTVNGQPLTGDALNKENARINRLLDPKEMQQKSKEQKEDEIRSKRIVAALPDAFVYKVVGTEEQNGHKLVNLRFTPNPNFSAPNRETLVLKGMEGAMTIDSTAMRLLKIDGTLMKDVSIGWGIIGRLDKAGRFAVEQKEVDNGDWEISYMLLNFTGKVLIFKTIRINEVDTSYDFRKVSKMSVAEAIDYLKKADSNNGAVAEKQ